MLVIIARAELKISVKRSVLFVDAYVGTYLEPYSPPLVLT